MITRLVDVTPEALDELLAGRSGALRILYLWGPDCPNCVLFKRCLPKLLERLVDVDGELVELNVYAHPEVATRYGVFGIPHFLLFKEGRKLGKMSEFRGENYWVQVVREHALG